MIKTRSKFVYDITIDAGENSLSFKENSTPLIERVASLRPVTYSLVGLKNELQKALNAAGNQTYTVSIDIINRAFVISAPSNFSILCGSGFFSGSKVYTRLGLGNSDLVGSNSYTTSSIGKVYRPQFYLLDYVDGENNQRPIDSVKTESSGGIVEIIKYGTTKLYEFTIDFITDVEQSHDSLIENDPEAVSKARDFLEFCVTQGIVEFYPDRDDPFNYVTIQLDSTSVDQRGLGFKIIEKAGIPDYYTSGLLVFRKARE